jgi:DNA (cytosine-5)-methyltransferase 1
MHINIVPGNYQMNTRKKKTKVTFVDLFAGAGGFSEACKAEYGNKHYDFRLAMTLMKTNFAHLAIRYN